MSAKTKIINSAVTTCQTEVMNIERNFLLITEFYAYTYPYNSEAQRDYKQDEDKRHSEL